MSENNKMSDAAQVFWLIVLLAWAAFQIGVLNHEHGIPWWHFWAP